MRTDKYENGWSGQKQDFMNQIRCQLDPKVEGACLETQRSDWCKTGSSVEMYGVESWVCVVPGGGDADWLDWRSHLHPGRVLRDVDSFYSYLRFTTPAN